MVAVRNAHFGQMAQKEPEKWIKTLGLELNDQKVLLKSYQIVLQLCPQKSQRPLLELGTEMVEILISLNMDLDTLNAALLFPLLDHNRILTQEQVEELWGKNIAKLVKGATDMEGIRALQTRTKERVGAAQADNLRHMLLAMVEDVRAVVIKLAERICFLRQIKTGSEEQKVIVAREVDSIYAPLANRLGIGQLKWELEDLAFSYLEPVIYKKIAKQLDEKRLAREQYITDFKFSGFDINLCRSMIAMSDVSFL
jgi:GTP pyrophosphokinase